MNRAMTVRRILKSFRSGSSWPVLVETSEGRRCVMKWRGTAEGPGAIAADYLTLRLARSFDIPVPESHILELLSDLIDPEQDPELNDLIRRSVGTNLGITEVPDHRPYDAGQLQNIPQALRDKIYAFDVLFLNMDRIESNPNMVISADGLLCWDFAAMMEMRKLIEKRTIKDELFYPLLRRHPFYRDAGSVSVRVPMVGRNELSAIVEELPADWLADGVDTSTIVVGLQSLIAQTDEILRRRFAGIDATPHESPEARSARSTSNRKAFEEAAERLSRRAPSRPGTNS